MGSKPSRRGIDHVWTIEDNEVEYSCRGEPVVRRDGILFLRFSAPNASAFSHVPDYYDNSANASFMLRVYPPHAPTREVALLFNGIDETIAQLGGDHDRLYRGYDTIGRDLAEAGILAILLPHPYHMNRSLCYKQADPKYAGKDHIRPTDALLKSPDNLYRNHFQALRETMALVRTIRDSAGSGDDLGGIDTACPLDSYALAAMRSHLAGTENVRISLVGYSLGGLRALSTYLRDHVIARQEKRDPLFHGCVCMNSGGGLASLPSPKWVDEEQWGEMIRALLSARLVGGEEKRFDGVEGAELTRIARSHFQFLDDVILGQGDSLNLLGANVAKSILFIIGGDDSLVPLQSLDRFVPSGGLNIFQIAGMGHFLSHDAAWERWRKVVTVVVREFVRDTKNQAATDRSPELAALLDKVMGILPYRTKISPDAAQWADEAKNRLEREVTSGDAWKSLFPPGNEPDQEAFNAFAHKILIALKLQVDTRYSWIYHNARRRLLLGYFLPGGRDRSRHWNPAAEAAAAAGTRFGDYLVTRGMFDQSEVDVAAKKQETRAAELRALFVEEFERDRRDSHT